MNVRERIVDAGRNQWVNGPQDIETRIALTAAREGLLIAKERLQAECGMCDGHGFTIETTTGSTAEHHPSCDGNCTHLCPVEVPIQQQEQVQCEYCGRPMSAIEALLAELSDGTQGAEGHAKATSASEAK